MKIKSFQGGVDRNLSYIIWCESTHCAGIIDASVCFIELEDFINGNNLQIEKIFITHTHSDHIQFLDDILLQFPQVQLCAYEKPEIELSNHYRKLMHHEIISLGSEIITILHTPGHYPDSLCFWNKKNKSIFTGDTMFVGRTGRTVGAKSNISHLYTSIYQQILKLPEETIIYPGHHYGYTRYVTLKENITLSPFFQCDSEEKFIKVMNKYEKNRRIK